MSPDRQGDLSDIGSKAADLFSNLAPQLPELAPEHSDVLTNLTRLSSPNSLLSTPMSSRTSRLSSPNSAAEATVENLSSSRCMRVQNRVPRPADRNAMKPMMTISPWVTEPIVTVIAADL